jgi:hypothetical protein
VTTTPLAYLHATLDAVEQEAEAARPGPWTVWNAHHNVAVVHDSGQRSGSGLPLGPLVVSASSDHALPDAVHIARHDPAAVLRRIAADRKILAAHPITRDVRDIRITRFGCRTCHKRDDRVDGRGYCDTLIALAEGWGWTEEGT